MRRERRRVLRAMLALDEASLTEITRASGVNVGRVSAVMMALERDELAVVTREVRVPSGRIYLRRLTPEGQRIAHREKS